MNRRDFLKVSGLASAALLVNVTPLLGRLADIPAYIESSGRLYRGTVDGKIYASADRGMTWALHADFGGQIAVLGFSAPSGGQVAARLAFQSRRFDVKLAKNGRHWITF